MHHCRSIYKNITKCNAALGLPYSIKSQSPLTKTWNVIAGGIKGGNDKYSAYPEHADVVIIGGGFIGSSIAYWLKTKAGKGLSVVVVDKDLSFRQAQHLVSFNTITQHYSLPENILLSQESAEFLRNIKDHLGNDVDIQFTPHDYLSLACEKYADTLEKNVQMQKEHGVNSKLLTVQQIKEKYPWVSTSNIHLGCVSTEKEGTFNSWNLHRGLLQKSKELGSTYVEAEVAGFEMDVHRDILMEGTTAGSFQKINRLIYKTEDNQEHQLKFAVCVISAGVDSKKVAALAKIGSADSNGLLSVPLPLETREYNVYSVTDTRNQTQLRLNTPFIMDTSGLWLRKNGLQNNFICSQIPLIKPDTDLSYNEYYNNIFKPSLINRLPNYSEAEINILSSERYDCNTYDDTGILGPHAYHTNLILATGFGRQGVQHAPGIGKAVAELIIDCQFTSTDLTRFGFDRILMDEPLIENNIY